MMLLSFKLLRKYSTSNKLVKITKNETTGTSIVSMARTPINAFNLELMSDLREAIEIVQKNESKGMILTSSLPTIFTAGLDLKELYKPNMERASKLWTGLQDTWMTLYSCGLPTVAAINGVCPGAGCVFAMACEYRIFVDGKHKMGLNEVALGIIPPFWAQEAYIRIIGYGAAELALLRGDQFIPQQALDIGLVHELTINKEDALNKAEKYISDYAQISPTARAETKSILRQPLIDKMRQNKQNDTASFIATIFQPKFQAGLDLYIQSLKKKS